MKALFQNATSFDWEMNDIKNLKMPPDQLFTPIVFWFWLNSQYFPYDAQFIAQKNFDQFKIELIDSMRKVVDSAQFSCLDTDSYVPEQIERL